MVAFGLACALVAQGRGRSPVAWFFIGWVIHVAGLILLLVLPDLGEEGRRHDALSGKTRLLRERQRLERQVADRRHEETRRRLAAHDRALGVDTSVPAWLDQAPSPPPLPDGVEAPEREREEWFYARGEAPVGPLARRDLERLARAGELDRGTLVWSPSLVDWRPAGSVPGLVELQHA
jgi:hypothetical protein